MALVAIRSTPYNLSAASESIGEVYDAIAPGLEKLGYTGVLRNDHVFGNKNGSVLVVQYLLTTGRSFWQVVTVGGDAAESVADSMISES